MVLIHSFNNNIFADIILIICGIGIHCNFHIILVDGISFRSRHFLDPVMADGQALWQDQVSVRIREIRFMGNCSRICGNLFHIFFMVKVINLKFRTRNQDCFLCLIIQFDDLQLCFKFIIQKHPPGLRCIRMVFRNPYDKIIHRLIVVGRSCLPYKISSKRKCNGTGISLFIGKDLRCPIFPDHNRLCREEIIASIFFCFQAAHQIGRETGTF